MKNGAHRDVPLVVRQRWIQPYSFESKLSAVIINCDVDLGEEPFMPRNLPKRERHENVSAFSAFGFDDGLSLCQALELNSCVR